MSRRVLFVGDPHATVEELDDCRALVELICKTAAEQKVQYVVFLGDLYHTHAVMHVEVMAFWRWAFSRIAFANRLGGRILTLLGNHDMPGNEASEAHALLAHDEVVNVIDKPRGIFPGVVAVPYCSSADDFHAKAIALGEAATLVCHQTFAGSQFENGLYAPDGADGNLIPQKFVISGHIHAPQSFGKVWYPGAPRWRTLSDANTERAIWVVDFDDAGNISSKTPVSTKGACREIRQTKVTPALLEGGIVVPEYTAGAPSETDANVSWRIDVEGPKTFCEQWAEFHRAQGCRVRTVVTDTARPARVKESEGIAVAFERWAKAFKGSHGTSSTLLAAAAKRRLGWA